MLDRGDVLLGHNQFELLTNAIEGLLDQLVEDWRADAPVAKQPWPGQANEVWNAVGQAIGVRMAADKWVQQFDGLEGGSDG